jgi:hypothetical protein
MKNTGHSYNGFYQIHLYNLDFTSLKEAKINKFGKWEVKMKKVSFLSVSAALFISVSLLGGTPVLAASFPLNSNADITFIQDNSVTSPVNPTNPSQTVTPNPDDPHPNGTAGPLSLDYISNFHFGSQTIQSLNAVYYAQLDKVTNSGGTLISVPNYAQVTDKRGLNLGWKLTVKQNGQFATSQTTPSVLTNASLSFVAATPNSTQQLALAPVTTAVTLDPSGSSSVPVATAAASTGMGTWTLAFGSGANANQGVMLTVPITATKVTNQQYKTTLTWTLNDSPI